jgi:hypothetical protein
VIETLSDSPLDVVAVYTVVPAGEQQPVSIATDRVAGNRLPLWQAVARRLRPSTERLTS